MQRATVLCHMVTSIDGKVAGRLFADDRIATSLQDYFAVYEKHFRPLSHTAFVGRVTAENYGPRIEDLTQLPPPDASMSDLRTDFVEPIFSSTAGAERHRCLGIVDPHGRMAWKAAQVSAADGIIAPMEGSLKLEVLVEDWVSDAFLSHCRRTGIPYLFAGKNHFDPQVLLQKAHSVLKESTVLLLGGGVVNGVFLKAGLVDELSVIVLPMVDTSENDPAIFQRAPDSAPDSLPPASYTVKKCEVTAGGFPWTWYAVRQ